MGKPQQRSNKGMKLTNLSEAPGETEAPLRAFRRFAAVRTGSQLIPGVRQTPGMIGGKGRSGHTAVYESEMARAGHVHGHVSGRPRQGSLGRGPTESVAVSDAGLPTRREAAERLALQRGVWQGAIQDPLERGRLGIVRPDVRLRHGCCTDQFGLGGTIPTGVSRGWVACGPVGPATEHAESEGAAERADAADEAQGGTRTAS